MELPQNIRCTCGKSSGRRWPTADGHALDCPRSTNYYTTAVEESNTEEGVVTNPAHYQFFPHVEAIEIIASSLTIEGFSGYCMGNRLKYRLRAGKKGSLEQDIAKSDFYLELFEKNKHLCRG